MTVTTKPKASKFWQFKNIAADKNEPEKSELRIDGYIVDDDDAWLYELFGIPASSPNAFREALAEYNGKALDVWINSPGGSVFAADGIYNALKSRSGVTNVKIDGLAASAASLIAMAGDTVQMSPVAIMMIHNPLTDISSAYASDLRKEADVLDEIKESIMNAYQMKTGKPRNKISTMMDDETYMSAKTAIKEGFADSMLYSDKPDEPQKAVNFVFSRNKIVNGMDESIKRLLLTHPPGEIEAARARLALQCLL
jgi:ATP-dependent Clp protease, protease subunit